MLDPTGLSVGAACPRAKAKPSLWENGLRDGLQNNVGCPILHSRCAIGGWRKPPRTPAMERGIGESVMDLFDEGVFPRSL